VNPSLVARPRWRSYLLLARVSNLPTVWTNVLAGTVAQVTLPAPETVASVDVLAGPLVAASLFYTGGMILNDAFDVSFDRVARPERPIPRGDVSTREAFIIGGVSLAAGLALLAGDGRTFVLGLLLAAAVVLYDWRHKQNAVAPLVMGACRGLVYLIAAASVGGPSTAAFVGAGVITAYVVGLTVVAKLSGPAARWRVPLLLAGISLVDAVFIGVTARSMALAGVAALGFPLTLALQRFVPGD
jgi:4-hydroxybenzoate polyprenyltransferase